MSILILFLHHIYSISCFFENEVPRLVVQMCHLKPPFFSVCKSQHSKCPQKKSKVNARSRIEKTSMQKSGGFGLVFMSGVFSPLKTNLITGCHQLDSHYCVFCVVVSNVFVWFGFVLFVLFSFLLLFCFFILMQLICPCEIWLVVKD